mmetsp:Transcript_145611/g.363185  ORF Transcript_145611/g.363185 Transcript_145611/m.363185 type:complete len:266 (-) Transcript_145611:394-1191(-)
MQEHTFRAQLRQLLVEPISQVIDASTFDLDVLVASFGWAQMFPPTTKPCLRGQLGSDVFDDFFRWLAAFLARPGKIRDLGGSAHKAAKYRTLSGKDSAGTWFKAALIVTVPPRLEHAMDGVVPVVLSLERKKPRRHPPPGSTHTSGCATILEEHVLDETASDATSTTQSSAQSRSSSAGVSRPGKPHRADSVATGHPQQVSADWGATGNIEFLRVVDTGSVASDDASSSQSSECCDDVSYQSPGVTPSIGTQELPRSPHRILMSL